MDIQKVHDYLEKHRNAPLVLEQDYFNLAICEVKLENYSEAHELFKESLAAMFGPRPFWLDSGQPNWLVDMFVISGRYDLFQSVWEGLNRFRARSTKIQPVGSSPMAHYCYSVMEILHPLGGDLAAWIKDLIKRPKYKDLYAAGLAFQAILDGEQTAFTDSLKALLKAHEGQAKHGWLRWTPDGWLSLPAMTLSVLARRRKLKVEVENEYLSLGYLEYLLEKGSVALNDG